MEPIIHQVTDPGDWPEPVSLLARSFCHPLPSWLSTGPFPATSSVAEQSLLLLRDTLNREPARVSEVSDTLPVACSLKAVFDLTLSTSTDLRELARRETRGYRMPTIAIWITYISALCRMLSDDISVLQHVSFIKPRQAGARSETPDGHATLVASHVVVPNAPPSSPSEKMDGSSAEDDMDDCSSLASSFSQPSIDLPFDAHLLVGRGRRLHAELPVLVIADSDNIIPLLSSVVYQRRVWGICAPAVGIVFSNTGTIGEVVFAWLSTSENSEDDLPRVEFAFAGHDCEAGPSLGVFDLATPVDAVSFTQFVLALQPHYQAVASASSIEAVNSLPSFSWRSDLVTKKSLLGYQWHDRMEQWKHDVHVHSSSEESSSVIRTPSPPTSDYAIDLPTNEMDKKKATLSSIAENEAPGGMTSSAAVRSTRSGDSMKGKSMKSKGEKSKGSSSHMANSLFGELSDNDAGEESSISNWLLERDAIIVSRVKLDASDSYTNINAKIDFYDTMTNLRWPEEWVSLDDVPRVDERVEPKRVELFNSYMSHYRMETQALGNSEVKCIGSQLSVLLHASDGAYTREKTSVLRNTNEAERRHDWDTMLMRFYRGEDMIYNTLLERMINTAGNPTAEMTVGTSKLYDQLLSLAHLNKKLCDAAFTKYPSTPDFDLDIMSQLREAVHQAFDIVTNLVIRRRKENGTKCTYIATHAAQEPYQAKTDAILVAPVEGLLGGLVTTFDAEKKNTKLLKDFVFVKHPGPESSQPPSKVPLYSPKGSTNDPNLAEDRAVSTQSSDRLSVPPHEPVKGTLNNIFLTDTVPQHLKDSKPEPATKPKKDEFDRDLLLPILVAEYKKKSYKTISQAVNQCRIYMVSALRFLRATGLEQQPVFGLVVSGSLGAVTMAWQENEKIFILERNVRHYNIADPFQALQFATVVVRLKTHAQQIINHFKDNQIGSTLINGFETEQDLQWSKQAQSK